MTEKALTIEDLNCTNCPHAEKTNSDIYPFKCTISKPVPMMVHCWALAWMRYTGCALHPLALQVLAAPVVGELERRANQAEPFGEYPASGKGLYLLGIAEAIKLLKDVKK